MKLSNVLKTGEEGGGKMDLDKNLSEKHYALSHYKPLNQNPSRNHTKTFWSKQLERFVSRSIYLFLLLPPLLFFKTLESFIFMFSSMSIICGERKQPGTFRV